MKFKGGNTCIVLEEPHQRIVTGKDPRSHHIIALSAKTATSLAGNKERLCGYLMANEDVRLQDLAYTTTARRMHHQFRRSYAVETMDDLLAELSKDSSSSIQTFKMGQVIFAFPGQGSMLPGMGRQLLNTSRTFRQHLIDIDRVSIQLGFPSFIHVATDVSSDLSLLGPTEAHLALVAFEIAMARLWQSWGIKPDLVIGHSIGEYSALCIAGVLSLNDTLFLVGKRAEMIQQHCTKQTHGMLLISCSVEEVKHLLSLDLTTSCEIACLNGPNSIVVGGPLEDIHRIQQSSQKRCKLLGIDYAFHTKQLDLILDSFERIARGIHFARPIIPVASTLRGDVMSDSGVFSATYLREQMRQQVDFLGALRSCKVKNFVNERSLWIEIGPGSMCLNMVQSTLDAPAANLLPTTKANDSCWKTLSESMAHAYNSGVTVDWMEWHQEYESSLQLLDLPNYCWDLKNYWIQYEEKYSKTADGAPKGMELPFLSTCLHRIESEEFSNGILTTTFKSDLRNSQLAELIQGHCVGGVALCPSSVFSEMALAAGSYVHSKLPSPEIKLATEITSLEIFSPLTSQPDAAFHSVEVQATNSMGPRFIQISIRSNTGSASQEHARCTMSFGESTQWISKWSRQVYLLEDRISRLMDYSASGVHHLRKEMVYKLFSSIVQYREAYQSIMEIHMDNKLNEAVAKVRFRNTPKDCTFTYDPCWLDCLAQVPGFILNGSVNIPQDVMYMSTGCGSLQVSTEISGDKEYLCYVRMHQLKSSTGFVGDVSLIDGDKTVAVGTGLKFQEIKKSMLPHLLGSNLSKPRGHRDSLAVDNTDRRRSESSIVGKRQFTNPNVASSATYEPQQAPISLPLKSYIDFEAILSIVAEEAGCKMSEITDETSFEELGVDSLLTISITSRVRTQANQTLPASIFVEFPTIGRLRAQFPPNAFSSIKTVKGNPEKRYDSSSNSSVSKELPTPPSISDSFTEPQADELADIFISALATETGLSMSEINNSSSFTDLGVDSLMGIAVIGRVKDCTSFEIPASIFTDHPTVAGLIEALARFSEDHGKSLYRV
jgi:iterative type I PKS product template protein